MQLHILTVIHQIWFIWIHAVDPLCSMLEKLFTNSIKGLTGIELDLTNLVNMVCCILSGTFRKILWCNASYSVQILEQLYGNGRKARNSLDASITSRRKQFNKILALKLRTVFLYCLNDRIWDEYIKEDTHVLVSNIFPSLSRKHNIVFCGTIHNNKNFFSPDEFLIKLKHYLSHNLWLIPNFCRVSPSAMNKYNLKKTTALLKDNLDDDRNSVYFHWYFLGLDYI